MWLIAKGRISEAEEILERASRVNKRPIPPHCLSEFGLGSVPNNLTGGNPESKEKIDVEKKNSSSHDQRTYTVLDLVRTPESEKDHTLYIRSMVSTYGSGFRFRVGETNSELMIVDILIQPIL